MTITWLPEETAHRLGVLDRAEDALQECGIGGIYDDFSGLADAIEQMVHYIKEIEVKLEQCDRERAARKYWAGPSHRVGEGDE